MAEPSEQISTKWVEGVERVCRDCGRPITNLDKQVGEIRRTFKHGRVTTAWMRCVDCRPKAR